MDEPVFKIQLRLLDKVYPYFCKREEEGKIRAAATNLTKKYMQYSSYYAGAGIENSDLIALAGLHFSLETLEENNREDMSPIFQTMERLNQQLEEYLQSVE
jgi:cell division protein ZapA